MRESEETRGEYGPPADTWRQLAAVFNRAHLAQHYSEDTPFIAITLSMVDGAPIPAVYRLYDAAYAATWWGLHIPKDIFYAALFDNDWFHRVGHSRLVREYMRGAKWLGPIRPPGLAM